MAKLKMVKSQDHEGEKSGPRWWKVRTTMVKGRNNETTMVKSWKYDVFNIVVSFIRIFSVILSAFSGISMFTRTAQKMVAKTLQLSLKIILHLEWDYFLTAEAKATDLALSYILQRNCNIFFLQIHTPLRVIKNRKFDNSMIKGFLFRFHDILKNKLNGFVLDLMARSN
jgi:hypothetical protein